jgi:hypothetical protein
MTDDNNKPDFIDIEPENIVEQKAPEATPIAPVVRRKGAKTFGLAAAALIAAGLAGSWIYRDLLANYFPSDQVQALASRVDGLETTNKSLSTKLDAVVGLTDEMKSQLSAAQSAANNADKLASGANADASAVKTSIGELKLALSKANTSIDELRTRTASGGTAAPASDSTELISRVDNLEKEVAGLKSAGTSAKPDMALLSQSLADLKAKISAGTSFSDELQRIQRLVPAADGLDVLSISAAHGLPNAQGLSEELKAISQSLPEAEVVADVKDDSWWAAASNMISDLVTIKSIGASDWRGLATQSAELAQQGNLAKAVEALEHGEGPLPVELQKWHDRAAERIGLEAALEKTSGAVLREIAAKG